jgi:hypothetical protein
VVPATQQLVLFYHLHSPLLHHSGFSLGLGTFVNSRLAQWCQLLNNSYCSTIYIAHAYIISGFRRDVDKKCILLCHYAARNDNSLPTFGDNIWVPSSRVKMGPIGCPKTSVRNYHFLLRNDTEERSVHENSLFPGAVTVDGRDAEEGWSGLDAKRGSNRFLRNVWTTTPFYKHLI